MEENQNMMKTGTTTVGLLCKDGVVLAADKRATVGHFIADNKAKDYGLSSREMEVLQLLSEGNTNKEIAKALWISEQTVKTHVAHIFNKLGTSDRTETVATALRNGLVT